MHIEGVGAHDAREVSQAIKTDYRTFKQRWTVRDNPI